MNSNKVIVWMQSSLDGFTAGPAGEFDWPQLGDELHTHFVSTLGEAGLFVYGRTVFEMMAGFWPIADTLPGSNANQIAYAKLWRPMPKAVLSRTLESADWNSTVVDDPIAIRRLAEDAAGDVYVFGGSQTVAALAAVDLVDEYQIFVHPVLLGAGTPFFPPSPARRNVALVEARNFDGNVAALRYRLLRSAARDK